SEAFNRACEGRVLDVLFERPGRQQGQLIGRSQYMQAVYVADPSLRIGDFTPVSITGGYANSLAGEIARREAA
ncbi:MAG: TRAM domain-containing protein, partial [Ferrovibrio sp.]